MPNTFLLRVTIRGQTEHIEEIWNTFFIPNTDTNAIRTKGWMLDDPLEHQIYGSGTVLKTPTAIAFSTHEGMDLHLILWQKAAAALPPGCRLWLAGFDMDDLDENSHGKFVEIETQSGSILKQLEPRAYTLCKTLFPQLLYELFPSMPSTLDEKEGVTVWNKLPRASNQVPVAHIRPVNDTVGGYVVSFQGREVTNMPDLEATWNFLKDLQSQNTSFCLTAGAPGAPYWNA